jgi:hypothetical protein
VAPLRHADRYRGCPVIGVDRTSPFGRQNDAIDPERTLRLFTIRGSFVSKKAPAAEAERGQLEVTRFSLCALLAFVSTPV